MNQNNFDRAKEFFLKAVQVDARCYQAYDQLITNSLLDPDEGIHSKVLTLIDRTCLIE